MKRLGRSAQCGGGNGAVAKDGTTRNGGRRGKNGGGVKVRARAATRVGWVAAAGDRAGGVGVDNLGDGDSDRGAYSVGGGDGDGGLGGQADDGRAV